MLDVGRPSLDFPEGPRANPRCKQSEDYMTFISIKAIAERDQIS